MSGKLGVALAGLGKIGQRHLQAIKKEQRCKLIALCSRKKAKAREWSHTWGSKDKAGYDDFGKMANRDDVDIIYICTPNICHKEQTIVAAEAKKHILLEKPHATTIADSEEMMKAVAKSRIKCLVGNQERFNPQTELAEKLVAHGILGKIYLARALFLVGSHSWAHYPTTRQWRLDANIAGHGEFLDDGAKRLDSYRWIAKCSAKRVIALSAVGKLLDQSETDDVNLSLMEFTNNSWGCFGGSYYNLFSHWPLEIYGTRGAAFLDFLPPAITQPKGKQRCLLVCADDTNSLVDLIRTESTPSTRLCPCKGDTNLPFRFFEVSFARKETACGSLYLYPYRRELGNLVDAITKGTLLRTPLVDYHKTLEAVLAAYESVKTERWVSLPLRKEAFPSKV